jgi:hypothetical protein
MTFEQLAICTKGLSNEFYLECFIIGLKEDIKACENILKLFHGFSKNEICYFKK